MNTTILLDRAAIAWFVLTAISVLYVAYDAFRRTPEMVVMKWGWLLVTLYTGPVGAAVYVLSCQEPSPGAHEAFVKPLWKQALGSTIHCMAGDATGVIVAAAITATFGLPMGIDSAIEYAFGFAFGLLIFQALFMRDMLGGSYLAAVRKSILPEWLSMNGVMAGMIPVMIVLMTRNMGAMDPRSVRFWAIMSLATLVGSVIAYPVNVYLVAIGLKHGMGTVRVLGEGGHAVAADGGATAMNGKMPGGAEPPAPGHAMPMPSDHAMSPARAAADRSAAAAAPGASGHGGMAMDGTDASSMRATATRAQLVAVTVLTLLALAGGVLIAALAGDLSMRPGMTNMPPATRADMHMSRATPAFHSPASFNGAA
jgi:Domain of unknown function (DUF4396)